MKDIKLLENCDGGANTRRKRYSKHGQNVGQLPNDNNRELRVNGCLCCAECNAVINSTLEELKNRLKDERVTFSLLIQRLR